MIVGDANMSEVANFLKVGTTSLVLAMIEDDWFGRANREFALHSPVSAMRRVSYDLTLTRPLDLADGRTMTALELQWEHLDLARKYAEERGFDAVGGAEIGREILRRWEEVLTGLEGDPMTLAKQLDWVAKYRIINGYRERHGLSWQDPKLAAMDLQYHDVTPERSLHARVGTERLLEPESVDQGGDRTARDHPGLLPRQVPAAVVLVDRRRQLGLAGVRSRWGSAAARPDDGTPQRNQRPRRRIAE